MQSNSTGTASTAVGGVSQATAKGASALGYSANATAESATALGQESVASVKMALLLAHSPKQLQIKVWKVIILLIAVQIHMLV